MGLIIPLLILDFSIALTMLRCFGLKSFGTTAILACLIFLPQSSALAWESEIEFDSLCLNRIIQNTDKVGSNSCLVTITDNRIGRFSFKLKARQMGAASQDRYWFSASHFQGYLLPNSRYSKESSLSKSRRIRVFPQISASLSFKGLEVTLYGRSRHGLRAIRVLSKPVTTLSGAKKDLTKNQQVYPAQTRNISVLSGSKLDGLSGEWLDLYLKQAPSKPKTIHSQTTALSPLPLANSSKERNQRIRTNPAYLRISTEADFEYYQFYGRGARARIQSVLNSVETIYKDQLAIRLDLNEQHQQRSPEQQLTATSALALLFQFRSLTLDSKQLGQSDAFHLFTGKSLSNGTLGLHFQGYFCRDNNLSLGLSGLSNSALQPLITAHELGHGFNATHPEDTLINPVGSLMTSFADLSHRMFSDFSLNEIETHLSSADSCLAESQTGPLTLIEVSSNKTSSSKGKPTSTIKNESNSQDACNISIYAALSAEELNGIGLSGNISASKVYDKSTRQSNVSAQLILRTPSFSSTRNRLIFRAVRDCNGTITRSELLSTRVPLSIERLQSELDRLNQL